MLKTLVSSWKHPVLINKFLCYTKINKKYKVKIVRIILYVM